MLPITLHHWLDDLSPIKRMFVDVAVVFGPLYLLSSYGVRPAWTVAITIGLAVFIWQAGTTGGVTTHD